LSEPDISSPSASTAEFPLLPDGVFGLLTEDGKLIRDEQGRALRVETTEPSDSTEAKRG
jgi:hypothetical protein